MEGVDRARDRVQERLDRLTEGDRSPTVNQETVVANSEQYRRAIERSLDGVFRVRVAVTDGTGDVLATTGEDEPALPCGRTEPNESLGTAARRIVREQAGLDCVPREVVEATISGVRNSDEPTAQAVYRLSIVYVAELADPTSEPDHGRWKPAHTVDAPL
jgi:ADP-ribose pyrophosphatase YjhB (NUDIX family)